MSLSAFLKSENGAKIGAIVQAADAISRMEDLSANGRPALLAVADRISQVAPSLSHTERQHVGRVVQRVLKPRGWRAIHKKRLPKGSQFTTAAVYERVEAVQENGSVPPSLDLPRRRLDAAARVAAARALLGDYPPLSGVDAFIAEKRREARRELAEYKDLDDRP